MNELPTNARSRPFRVIQSFLLDLTARRTQCQFCGAIRAMKLGRPGFITHQDGCRFVRVLQALEEIHDSVVSHETAIPKGV